MPRILMERSGEMEVFARVVQDGGFSAAARNLDITPSAVSKLIARLEARLGTRLLVRTTRALTLTEEGEAYHHAALRILQALNDADQQAAGGATRGRLRINTTVAFGTMFVAPAVPEFIARNPNVVVDLSFNDGVVDLLAEKTDVAIRMGNLPDSSLIARKLGQSRRVVCAAPSYLMRRPPPAVPADLERHDCLTFNFRRDRPTWPFTLDGQEVGQPVKGSIIVNNGETMKQIALAGAGIARVGLFHVADEIAAGRLVPLLEEYNPGDLELVHAIYVGGGPLPHRVRAFIEHMVSTLNGSPLLG
ncbi:DNA-binding transcriptional regulator, LysR family [Rhizobium aethiopicum]|uniref:HTH-type transcriptional regulator TtuA n=1 Tax=Rhizobium aethiopicum TaxID=1138170 RepID=A0A1C3YBC6_9HYPH|nr:MULTISPECIES: LysR family transcriptional regulator [Rhizobium]SCB61743.1 DNA-binding transcriptional regulator, LysR family [Rhizobium aethiopicum]